MGTQTQDLSAKRLATGRVQGRRVRYSRLGERTGSRRLEIERQTFGVSSHSVLCHSGPDRSSCSFIVDLYFSGLTCLFTMACGDNDHGSQTYLGSRSCPLVTGTACYVMYAQLACGRLANYFLKHTITPIIMNSTTCSSLSCGLTRLLQ